MNWEGVLLGFSAYLIIGLFHPVVAKAEYYFGKKIWPAFFVAGLFFAGLSLFCDRVCSILSGILAFSLFWSTIEIFKQHERVLKGQAKANPKRQYK